MQPISNGKPDPYAAALERGIDAVAKILCIQAVEDGPSALKELLDCTLELLALKGGISDKSLPGYLSRQFH